jgi:hypothetical protein
MKGVIACIKGLVFFDLLIYIRYYRTWQVYFLIMTTIVLIILIRKENYERKKQEMIDRLID